MVGFSKERCVGFLCMETGMYATQSQRPSEKHRCRHAVKHWRPRTSAECAHMACTRGGYCCNKSDACVCCLSLKTGKCRFGPLSNRDRSLESALVITVPYEKLLDSALKARFAPRLQLMTSNNGSSAEVRMRDDSLDNCPEAILLFGHHQRNKYSNF